MAIDPFNTIRIKRAGQAIPNKTHLLRCCPSPRPSYPNTRHQYSICYQRLAFISSICSCTTS